MTGSETYIAGHGEFGAALHLGVAGALSGAVVVIVLVVVITIGDVVHLGAGVASKVLGAARIFFAIVLEARDRCLREIGEAARHVRGHGAERCRVCQTNNTGTT